MEEVERHLEGVRVLGWEVAIGEEVKVVRVLEEMEMVTVALRVTGLDVTLGEKEVVVQGEGERE